MEEFKNVIRQRLESKFPDFENDWNNLINSYDESIISFIRASFTEELKSYKELATFRFSIVIDNNFLFSQIYGAVKNESKIENTFIYKLSKSNIVTLYAPHKIKEEIQSKIQLKIKENSTLAQEYADKILANITIEDAEWIDEWKKASNLFSDIDQDDIPYLALALHKESHSILSSDDIFNKQGCSNVWSNEEAKNVIGQYKKGFMSFFILGGTAVAIKVFFDILLIVFQVIGQILLEILNGIGILLASSLDLINKIPTEAIFAILGLYIGGLIFSEEFRELNLEALDDLGDLIEKNIDRIKNFIDESISKIIDLLIELKPIGITALEVLGYISLEFKLMMDQIEELEKQRAK